MWMDLQIDRQMDRQTDLPVDGWTDRPPYRVARGRLKTTFSYIDFLKVKAASLMTISNISEPSNQNEILEESHHFAL